MSDREWIDRVRSTRPEDLSSGDVGKLRDEARRSPEVRKALADEIQLDQALHASVGRSPLSTSKIVAHVTAAAALAGAGGSIVGTIIGWLGVLLVTATVGVVGVLTLPEPGAGPKRETLSPEKSVILESPRSSKDGVTAGVERIDPIEDPRYADDGSSPSDKLPSTIGNAGDSPAGLAKSSVGERPPGAEKQPSVKAPHESEDSPRPPRGSKSTVTQK